MRRLSLAVVWAGFVARSTADMISVLDSLNSLNSGSHDTHHFETACALGNTETLQASFAIMLRDDNFVDPNSPLNDNGDTCLHLMLRAAAPGKTRRESYLYTAAKWGDTSEGDERVGAIQYLLDVGGDPRLINGEGFTALNGVEYEI